MRRWALPIVALVLNAHVCVDGYSFFKLVGRKPNRNGRFFPRSDPKFTIHDMECHFHQQPLNHFSPAGRGPSYQQRYCIFDGFVKNATTAPIFLYTGNESPLEEYINNTGLMWESAPQFEAQVIFMEHRYEGKSLPPTNLTEACMSYCSSKQALADYVALLDILNPGSRRPVIAFGGSYGGMLSSWLRMKYPNMVAGAIAGSAPIWAFPRTRPNSLDTAFQVVQHGMQQSYPPTDPPRDDNHCSLNLLAAWPLIQFLGSSVEGRQHLTETFRLCQPLRTQDDAFELIEWGQSPWFDLAEGSFPYPSSYITFALHMGPNNLPAWPLQAACWNTSELHRDWGIDFLSPDGTFRSDVKYTIVYGDPEMAIAIDWDEMNPLAPPDIESWTSSKSVNGLLRSVRDAVSVWFNVTQDAPCFNVTPAENMQADMVPAIDQRKLEHKETEPCIEKRKEGSWNSLCCNEDMNLIITYASGMGYDMFWPPTYPKHTKSYRDLVGNATNIELDYCEDVAGQYGYPATHDPWSGWMDVYYGGLHISSHSNIVFSNGLLDPWSAGGVYKTNPHLGRYEGPMVQNITEDGGLAALIIEFGGHHTDLMYSDPNDPPCVTEARKVERDFIARWIKEWNSNCHAIPA